MVELTAKLDIDGWQTRDMMSTMRVFLAMPKHVTWTE